MTDATDTAWPQFQTPASKHRNEQWERLEAMAADDAAQKWDFSDNDITAIEWALSEIDRLMSESARLRMGAGPAAPHPTEWQLRRELLRVTNDVPEDDLRNQLNGWAWISFYAKKRSGQFQDQLDQAEREEGGI